MPSRRGSSYTSSALRTTNSADAENCLVVHRAPGEVALGLGLAGLVLRGVGRGSPAERSGAARFIGRTLRGVNGHAVVAAHQCAELAGMEGPAMLEFEPEHESERQRVLDSARKLLREYEKSRESEESYDACSRIASGEWVLRRRDPRLPLGLDLREPGLAVESVRPGSPADHAGLGAAVGHCVTHVDGQPVHTTADFAAMVYGKVSVGLALSENMVGCLLLRGNVGIPFGFATAGSHMELVSVDPGSPAGAACMHDFLGCALTHVDNQPVGTPEELHRATRRKVRTFIRLAPLPEESGSDPATRSSAATSRHSWTATQPCREVAITKARDGGDLGLNVITMAWQTDEFSPEEERIVLESVDPDSIAQAAGLEALLGHCITHVNGVEVHTIRELTAEAARSSRLLLRFEVPVAQSRAHRPTDVGRYREWLHRRRDAAGRAAVPCRPRFPERAAATLEAFYDPSAVSRF